MEISIKLNFTTYPNKLCKLPSRILISLMVQGLGGFLDGGERGVHVVRSRRVAMRCLEDNGAGFRAIA